MYEALQQLDPIKINFSASGNARYKLVLSFIMYWCGPGNKPAEF
jgi:hypothetical protein